MVIITVLPLTPNPSSNGRLYSMMFFTSSSFVSPQIRHNVRPHFQGSLTHQRIYDVITWAGTQVAICYTVVPFVLLAVETSLKFYK